MSLGSAGAHDLDGADDARLFTEMNVTPLTDVFLVLLIILMVTAPGLSTGSIQVTLPKAAVPGSVDAAKIISVDIDAGSRFYLEQKEVPAERLEDAIRAALGRGSGEQAVVLVGDRAVPLDRLVVAMEAARRAGAKKFSVAVARQETADAR